MQLELHVYVSVVLLLISQLWLSAEAAELEPRLWWTPNVLNAKYSSPQEAFLAYKAMPARTARVGSQGCSMPIIRSRGHMTSSAEY